MSPRQWLALLCFYLLYMFFGAWVFYYFEHNKELEERDKLFKDRIKVNELLVKFASPEDENIQNGILDRVSNYCGRPVTNYTLDEYPVDYKRTFYHSFWFTFILTSTLGYGSSSPHDLRAQAFLIFYALIGLPLNGFVLTYLAEFFSKTFVGIYKRYKGQEYANTHNYAVVKKFGLVSRIMMFLIPGIALFIFLPACLFTYFEDWPYVTSVYYAFITLTTIGFGDYVPTFQDGQARKFGIYFNFYQAFIIIWNVVGMGYFIMIISFIAKGMQSKRVARLEHQLAANLKVTQNRIWSGVTKDLGFLRRILNEVNLTNFTPVYTDSTDKIAFNLLPRSLSCPDITIYQSERPRIARKRFHSENYHEQLDSSKKTSTMTLNRTQSDGDLSRIDKEKTFKTVEGSNRHQTQDLLSNILSALGSMHQLNDDELSLSKHSSAAPSEDSWTNRPARQRAFSDFHVSQQNDFTNSNELTWNGNNDTEIQEYLRNKPKKFSIASMVGSKSELANRMKSSGQTSLLVPLEGRSRSFISRMNPFKERVLGQNGKRHSVSTADPQNYLNKTAKGRESCLSLSKTATENMELLEKTTIADLIRAVESVQGKSTVSHHTPLLADYRGSVRTKSSKVTPSLQLPSNGSRRGSLRPVPTYTTIFTSQNVNRITSSNLVQESASSSRRHSINPDKTTPNSTRKNLSQNLPSPQILRRTFSLRPSPLATPTINISNTRTPTITIQPPDDTTKNLWWPPESAIVDRSVNELKKRSKHKRADSK